MAAKGRIEQAAARRLTALEMRKTGASYRTIATALKISHVQAGADIKTALAALATIESGLADDVRTLELARLDDMQLALATQVRQGNHSAIDRTLRIMERRSKYLGLDAPQRQEVTGCGQELFKIYIATSEFNPDDA